MKKALIVSPYLDHLGGGERYMLTIASVLESLGNDVYFSWDNLEEINKLGEMLGLTLKSPKLDPNIKKLYFANNPLAMYLATRAYDIVVYLSDGSMPLLGGKKNIIHMQVPFHGVGGKSWKNILKKQYIHHVIVNSKFTKNVVDKEYGINSTILYPPVQRVECSGEKENIILSVGRFEPSLNTKKQNILIDVWRALSPELPGWKLILAGASVSDDWMRHLHTHAIGLPIDFEINVSYDKLCELYCKAAIYWHAAGYGVDPAKNPELTEHFGISTVESVTAGCIPVVVPVGGQSEIVSNEELHWNTKEELVQKTLSIINNLTKKNYLEDIKVAEYDYSVFATKLKELIK